MSRLGKVRACELSCHATSNVTTFHIRVVRSIRWCCAGVGILFCLLRHTYQTVHFYTQNTVVLIRLYLFYRYHWISHTNNTIINHQQPCHPNPPTKASHEKTTSAPTAGSAIRHRSAAAPAVAACSPVCRMSSTTMSTTAGRGGRSATIGRGFWRVCGIRELPETGKKHESWLTGWLFGCSITGGSV